MTSATLICHAYGLGVIPVVLPDDTDAAGFEITDTAYTGPGKLFNSGPWDGMDVEEGKRGRSRRLRLPGQARARRPTGFVTGVFHASGTGDARFGHPL